MSTDQILSPAENASIECIDNVYKAISEKKNFLVEAGAGAGKTYTLIKSLKYLIENQSSILLKNNQKIACITYTNIAKDEIRSRTDNHPVIYSDTIHAFAWEAIKDFQKSLREKMICLGEKWNNRIEQIGGIDKQQVKYDLGYPKVTENDIYLHHDDVIKLFSFLLNEEKFQRVLLTKFPVIFIDEYQDTNADLAETLVNNFIELEKGPLIGFFGDHWQKIYGSKSCGLISATDGKLTVIGKGANFRSDKNIVAVLNRMRPELYQHESDPSSEGEILIYHTNSWGGQRRTENHWQGDVSQEAAHDFLETLKESLTTKGWDLSAGKTKILMLTNNVLASEQGYQNIFRTFNDTDDYLKKNDEYIKFLADIVEPGVIAFNEKKFGQMFEVFNSTTTGIKNHADKVKWHEDITALNDIRSNNNVGDAIDLLKTTGKPKLSRKVYEREQKLQQILSKPSEEWEEEEKKFADRIQGIRAIPYGEVTNVVKYIDDKTLYSTKHGVKGAEFENVIIVLGRGWNHYNWNKMLELSLLPEIPAKDKDFFERNRNLFYVACSRPMKRLCLLFTQELSQNAFVALEALFGDIAEELD